MPWNFWANFAQVRMKSRVHGDDVIANINKTHAASLTVPAGATRYVYIRFNFTVGVSLFPWSFFSCEQRDIRLVNDTSRVHGKTGNADLITSDKGGG